VHDLFAVLLLTRVSLSLYLALVFFTRQGEGWISRQASGLCFDFAPDDPSTYVTGTEEGNLHRCSVSYSEQYLDTYDAHSGPVYRVRFSPWWGDVFLSCSADWTMSLYHMRSTWPLLTFHSGGEDFSVNDIAWCPGNSTVSQYNATSVTACVDEAQTLSVC
jgi:dynein intermediate chain 4, axonemal